MLAALTAAGMTGPADQRGNLYPHVAWARADYERACGLAGLTPRNDAGCAAAWNQTGHAGGDFLLAARCDTTGKLPAVERDAVAELGFALALRRAHGMAEEADARTRKDPCDECGVLIPAGSAMLASLGRACSPECYDAMADRPGRYASRRARQ
jgi:hypothetical protein